MTTTMTTMMLMMTTMTTMMLMMTTMTTMMLMLILCHNIVIAPHLDMCYSQSAPESSRIVSSYPPSSIGHAQWNKSCFSSFKASIVSKHFSLEHITQYNPENIPNIRSWRNSIFNISNEFQSDVKFVIQQQTAQCAMLLSSLTGPHQFRIFKSSAQPYESIDIHETHNIKNLSVSTQITT